MMQKKSEDAVSPVIGVMLMVVITVVIAGVIAAFGTSMVGNTEPAPSAVLDVEIINFDNQMDGGDYPNLMAPDFRITHLSGDPIDTGDIEIRFSWTDSDKVKHSSTYSATSVEGVDVMYLEVPNAGIDVNPGSGSSKLKGIPFGEAELETGYTIKTVSKALGNVQAGETEHKKSKYMDYIFNNGQENPAGTTNGVMDWLEKGTKVDVTILHIPSNSIIYDKAVIVK